MVRYNPITFITLYLALYNTALKQQVNTMLPLHDDNPTTLTPIITYVTIVVCTVIFFWQISLGQEVQQAVFSLGAIPAVLFNIKSLPPDIAIVPAWMTVFTSMFLHGGWMHLIGNMLYLWIFGNNVEDAMGHQRFILFYFLCGIIAVLAHAQSDINSETPMIGASGAISGILGAYLLLYPHARVLVVIPLGIFLYTTRLPAGWILGFWFLLQIVNSYLTANTQGGGVAWGAHIGGFVAGLLLILVFRRKGIKLLNPARAK